MNSTIGSFVTRVRTSPFVWVWIATAVLACTMALVTPSAITALAIANMMPFAGMLAVATLGQAVVLMQRGFDFSLVGIIAIGAIGVARLTGAGATPVLAIAASVLVCTVCGVLNGLLVSWLALPPLVATLASNSLYLGIAYLISDGVQVSVSAELTGFATARIAGLAMSAWIAIIVIVLLLVLIRLTVFGRRFVAVGSSPEAAHASGLPVTTARVSAYAIAGLCFGIAGVLIAGFVGSASLASSGTYLMASISALMVAGGAAAGTRTSLVAAAVGAVFITLLTQFVLALGASTATQSLIQGIVLILAVALPGVRLVRRKQRRATRR